MNNNENNTYMSISKAAKITNRTHQAIYIAIRKGLLEATMIKNLYYVTKDNLIKYQKSLFNRAKSLDIDGNPLYDKSKDEYSISEAAKLLSITKQCAYYFVRENKINYKLKKSKSGRNVKIILLDEIKRIKSLLKGANKKT